MSLRRNCISTGVLCGLGDVLAQTIDPHQQKYQPGPTLRNMIYGFCVFGPIGHRLYPLLARINPFHSGTANLATRVAVDQLLWSPIGVALYFSAIGLMERNTPDQLEDKFRRVYWQVLYTNWCVWPLFQALNFTLVPVPWRLTAVNVASVFWNCFLSWQNRHAREAQH